MESLDFRQTLKFIEVTASSNFNYDWVSKKSEEMVRAFAICLILPSLHFLLIFTNTVYLFFVEGLYRDWCLQTVSLLIFYSMLLEKDPGKILR